MAFVEVVSGLMMRENGPGSTIKRIVVSLDGTAHAERATPVAMVLARRFNAELILVYANESWLQPGHAWQRKGRWRGRLSPPYKTIHSASLYLARIEQELRTHGVRVQSRVCLGAAADVILAVATACSADLIVIAMRSSSRHPAGSPLPSAAREVAYRTKIPVLLLSGLVRGILGSLDGRSDGRRLFGERFCAGERYSEHELAIPTSDGRLQILFPLISDANVASALSYATLLVRAFDGRVVLISADDKLASSAIEQVGGYLGDQHIVLRSVRGEMPPGEDVASLACASADLVVMGMSSSMAQRVTIVEMALAMLQRSGTPLLLVPC